MPVTGGCPVKRHAQRADTQGRGGRSALTDAVWSLRDTNDPSPSFRGHQKSLPSWASRSDPTKKRHAPEGLSDTPEAWPALQLGCLMRQSGSAQLILAR